MGWLMVTKEVDERFIAELKALDMSVDWKMRACAGRTTAEVFGDLAPEQARHACLHGLRRAMTPLERQAWLWGFEWTPGLVPRALETLGEDDAGRLGLVLLGRQ